MSISFELYLPSTNVEGDDDPLRDWFTNEDGWFKNMLLPIIKRTDPHVSPLRREKSLTEDCEGDAQSEAPGLDIGTHAYGWVFMLSFYPGLDIFDLDDWERLWSLPGAEIRADNGDVLTPEEMRDFVMKRPFGERLPLIDDEAPDVPLIVTKCGVGERYNWADKRPPERCRLVHFEKVYGRNTRPSDNRQLLVPVNSHIVHPGKFGDSYVLVAY
jgi:hypothetical protein